MDTSLVSTNSPKIIAKAGSIDDTPPSADLQNPIPKIGDLTEASLDKGVKEREVSESLSEVHIKVDESGLTCVNKDKLTGDQPICLKLEHSAEDVDALVELLKSIKAPVYELALDVRASSTKLDALAKALSGYDTIQKLDIVWYSDHGDWDSFRAPVGVRDVRITLGDEYDKVGPLYSKRVGLLLSDKYDWSDVSVVVYGLKYENIDREPTWRDWAHTINCRERVDALFKDKKIEEAGTYLDGWSTRQLENYFLYHSFPSLCVYVNDLGLSTREFGMHNSPAEYRVSKKMAVMDLAVYYSRRDNALFKYSIGEDLIKLFEEYKRAALRLRIHASLIYNVKEALGERYDWIRDLRIYFGSFSSFVQAPRSLRYLVLEDNGFFKGDSIDPALIHFLTGVKDIDKLYIKMDQCSGEKAERHIQEIKKAVTLRDALLKEYREAPAQMLADLDRKIQNLEDDLEENHSCPITREPFQYPVTTPCGHTFEKESLVDWLKRSSGCPSCRKPVGKAPSVVDEKIKESAKVAQEKLREAQEDRDVLWQRVKKEGLKN